MVIKINLETDFDKLLEARSGDMLELSGTILSARDAAHSRIRELVERGGGIPFSVKNKLIYYMGPTPAREGYPIGSCGPTSSYRMDEFLETVCKLGSIGSIGKGERSGYVADIVQKYRSPYLVTFGGASAYLAKRVKNSKILAFPDLGAEAVYELEADNFPVIVAMDIYGNSVFS
ncbi:MAG TPA: FumA C-terminus/TtdB family hydratase beta subunit [Spirochaetota bacterium]|jgi:fumarate hydratase subunit beta|nr:MAG: Fumarate hydratase class I, anaerobic [Spirochaetes bacterium ADurb.Bin133]HNZ26206.1 FumA C-terminus/TtdB family hydratase beta subunit [Spirochaetota bacterium]HPY87089.1 FumA C-terminus/TtdB family hydratase beta subunit [Spirochaetota bacterium]HQB62416.1 FumA C-terminus/TtdB family hydratase beta subunit [Spirochaetota bacterium]